MIFCFNISIHPLDCVFYISLDTINYDDVNSGFTNDHGNSVTISNISIDIYLVLTESQVLILDLLLHGQASSAVHVYVLLLLIHPFHDHHLPVHKPLSQLSPSHNQNVSEIVQIINK